MSRRVVRLSLLLVCLLLLSLSSATLVVSGPIPDPSATIAPQASGHCPPLGLPGGNIVNVSSESALIAAANGASSGDTIMVADGTYAFGDGDYMRITASNVTIRSASGNRDGVVIDGNYQAAELIQIVASDVTIADLTLREAYDHPIHVMSTDSSDTLNTRIYNVHIVDPGQQAIKINPYRPDNALYFIDDGEVACSHIELTSAGRPHIRDNCYTGGVDAHQAMGWTIRDNVIEGFWCSTGLSEHAIHMWKSCRDTVVERNVLRNNARGVGFGMDSYNSNVRTYAPDPCPGALGGYVDHYGGIIRNNFVFANDAGLFASQYGFDCGICLWQACNAQVPHNTVFSTSSMFASIEWRYANTVADIRNNLVNRAMMERDGASATQVGNVTNAQASWFVDGAGGDLHLLPSATSAVDQGASVTGGLCDDDIDGDARPSSGRDVGADEYRLPVPHAVTNLRVTQAVTSATMLTATLRWTAPADAVTTTLRFSYSPITTEGVWDGATTLTDTLPGGDETFTATVTFEGGTAYFGLKTANDVGFSDLSNSAFWPRYDVFLPVVLRAY